MKPTRSILALGLAFAACAPTLHAELFQVYQDTGSSPRNAAIINQATGVATALTVNPVSNRKGYINFAVGNSGIAAADVLAARVTIYLPTVTAAGYVLVHNINSAWTETFSAATNAAPALDDYFTFFYISTNSARQFVTIDVTTQVKAWLTGPSSEHGLAFASYSTAACTITSKEGASSGHPAVLEIDRVRLSDGDLFLRGGTDPYHGLGWYGSGKGFSGNESIDGPVLYGYTGGALGTAPNGVQSIALTWDYNKNVNFAGNASFSSTATFSGNVGIGISPASHAKVDISGSAGTYSVSHYSYLDYPGVTTSGGSGTFGGLSLYADQAIAASYCLAFSDERIKRVAGRSDAIRDLATLRDIEVTDYTYIDTIAKGTGQHKKVIAQQVEKVFPQAVRQSTDVVPDIYQKATLKDGWVQLASNLKVGERVKLISDKEEAIQEVLEVRDGAFRTAFKSAIDKVFVFGREVKDFRSVDYEAIAMLNVSATQEIYRKLESKEAEITALRAQLIALESRDQAREARLTRLEKALDPQPAVQIVGLSPNNPKIH